MTQTEEIIKAVLGTGAIATGPLATALEAELARRDLQIRPAISIGWQPAVDPEGKIPWIWLDSGAVAWSSSPNVPPTDGGRWALLYVQTKNGEPVQ